LIRSIFCDRSKPRYKAVQVVPAVFAPTVWSHGPNDTELFLKFPPASAKNPTVFNPPNVVPLPATIAPAPALAVGSYVNRTGPPLFDDISAAYTKYVPSGLFRLNRA
jgi:hypothetical protein